MCEPALQGPERRAYLRRLQNDDEIGELVNVTAQVVLCALSFQRVQVLVFFHLFDTRQGVN
jgi:hypothetical protein